jgi:hypothetical protein
MDKWQHGCTGLSNTFGKYTSYRLRCTCKTLYFDDQMLLENISLCKQCTEKQVFVELFLQQSWCAVCGNAELIKPSTYNVGIDCGNHYKPKNKYSVSQAVQKFTKVKTVGRKCTTFTRSVLTAQELNLV